MGTLSVIRESERIPMRTHTLFLCWPRLREKDHQSQDHESQDHESQDHESPSTVSPIHINVQLTGQNEERHCHVLPTETIGTSLYRELALGPLDRPSRVLFGGLPVPNGWTWEHAGVEEGATVMVDATLWLDEVDGDLDLVSATLQGEAMRQQASTGCGWSFWRPAESQSVAGLVQALQAVHRNACYLPRSQGEVVSEQCTHLLGSTVQGIRYGRHDERVQQWGTKALCAIMERGTAYKRCLVMQGAHSAAAALQRATTNHDLVAKLCRLQKKLAEDDWEAVMGVTDRAWLQLLSQDDAEDADTPVQHEIAWSSDDESSDDEPEELSSGSCSVQRGGVTDAAWAEFLERSDALEPTMHRAASWRTDSSTGSIGG